MTPQFWAYVGFTLLGMAFSAGVAWGVTEAKNRRLAKDLNGLGKKLQCIDASLHDRYLTICLVLMVLAREAHEEQRVAEMLHDFRRGQ